MANQNNSNPEYVSDSRFYELLEILDDTNKRLLNIHYYQDIDEIKLDLENILEILKEYEDVQIKNNKLFNEVQQLYNQIVQKISVY